jgi:hypothetical protein
MGASIAKNTSGGGTTFPGGSVSAPREGKGGGPKSPTNPVKSGSKDFIAGGGCSDHFTQVTAQREYGKKK